MNISEASGSVPGVEGHLLPVIVTVIYPETENEAYAVAGTVDVP